ncbi:protein-export chaperone SecB [Lactobacillus amylovorus]|uniref:Protein-export chaperone SecB n=1 Tax=Lactobacillus amylovorus TaxID=1604 RepID=A0AAW6BE52_LACAM|nr:protein-export chaperone SecB [Lactobacillus amylovorus]MDA6090310.1 protein-export chaperone SecB [Lactobacillus amylovorus]MDB6247651.1 protein-export chaperone SecB [Lactobacillus amylovorus]
MEQNDAQKTPISFKGYRIKKLEYGLDIKVPKSDIEIQYGISKDKKLGQVTITVNFNDESKKSHGILVVTGQFDLADNLTDKQLHIFLGQNGAAILYPYVRSILSMITALDDNRVEILPTLNFVNLAKNNKIKREQ